VSKSLFGNDENLQRFEKNIPLKIIGTKKLPKYFFKWLPYLKIYGTDRFQIWGVPSIPSGSKRKHIKSARISSVVLSKRLS
jgi:hypothetical protein